jgi:hypothetical protein
MGEADEQGLVEQFVAPATIDRRRMAASAIA